MIFLAVVNGQPRELGLAEAIRVFIDHRIEVVQRRTVYLLRKAREREHILEGLKIALDNLDTVIKIIRASASRADARENLLRLGQGHRNYHQARPRARAPRRARPHPAPGRRHSRTPALSPHPALRRRAPEGVEKSASKSPSTKRSSAARRSSAPSSSRSLKTFATSTATSGAPRSSTRAPKFSLKTSSPTSRSPSPSATRATSSARPSPSIASSAAAAPAAWA